MSALEEIEAAINKLSGLWALSTRGPWDGPDEAPWAYDEVHPDDAALVVTLHRSIDAQLAVLRAALSSILETDNDPQAVYSGGRHMDGSRLLKVAPWGRAAVDLARAINGTAS